MKNLKKEALSDIKDWESIEIKFYLDGGLYLDIQDDEKSKSQFIDYTKKRIEDNKPLEDFSGFFRFEFKKLVDDLSLNRDGVIPIHSCFLTYKSDENGFSDNAFQSQEGYEKNKKELEDRWEKEKQEEKKKLN